MTSQRPCDLVEKPLQAFRMKTKYGSGLEQRSVEAAGKMHMSLSNTGMMQWPDDDARKL
ncbi:hypothetical protein F2Q68_00019963 [Brassica cretica]|uniref:Uncharacterized protein n=1 Tax=Brassica cretica TaxID=69181 RepID=A0A8S9FWV3_BRACR|nr:hypothetical protein F2Q68_00019963 [Brassica cretica]